jgi:hypothetical protein
MPKNPPYVYPEPTPTQLWWQQWDARQESTTGLEGKLALAQQALDEGPDPDDEFLIESFESVLIALEKAGRHAERIALIDQLKARFPLGFAHSEAHFIHERFESAIELPGADWVAETRTIGAHATRLAHLFAGLPARLAWEGHVDALRALIEAGWPQIREDDELTEWAVGEWADQGVAAVVLEHLERDPTLKAEDPALAAEVAIYELNDDKDQQDDEDQQHDEDDEDEDQEDDESEEEAMSLKELVRLWVGLLQGSPGLPADPAVLTRLGRRGDEQVRTQVVNLTAVVGKRLREKQGWTRSQLWVLLREMGPLLLDCAQRVREEKPKAQLRELLLPPASLLLDRLATRNAHLFSSERHTVAAVVLALPAWAGLVAEQGWATEAQAHTWQQQVMGEASARWTTDPPAPPGDVRGQMQAFVAGQGRSREAWLTPPKGGER